MKNEQGKKTTDTSRTMPLRPAVGYEKGRTRTTSAVGKWVGDFGKLQAKTAKGVEKKEEKEEEEDFDLSLSSSSSSSSTSSYFSSSSSSSSESSASSSPSSSRSSSSASSSSDDSYEVEFVPLTAK